MESFCGPRGHFRLVDSEARGVSEVQSSTAITSEQGNGGKGGDGCEEAASVRGKIYH